MALYEAAIVTGIAGGGIYALIAVGITQIYKVTRILNFAHAGFMMWAAYIYSALTEGVHLLAVPAALLTLVAVSAMGAVCEMVVFRFGERASTANKIILTVGLLQFLTALAVWVFGPNPKGATPLVATSGVRVFDTVVGFDKIADVVAAAVVVIGVGAFLRYTRLGLLTRAMAEDGTMTEMLGANRSRIGVFNWALAAGSAGLGGILFTSLGPFTNDLFFDFFTFSLLATMVGGLQSLTGTAVGGLLLGVIENLIVVSNFSFGNIAIFGAIVVLALYRKSWLSEVSGIRWARTLVRDESRSWWLSTGFAVVCLAGLVLLVVSLLANVVWTQTAVVMLVYVIAAMSLMPILYWTGQVSLASGGLMGIGAFATASALDHDHLAFPIALLAGALIAGVFGLALGVFVHRLSFVLTVIVTLQFTNIAPMFMGGRYAPWVHVPVSGAMVEVPSFMGTPLRLLGASVILTIVVAILLSNLRASSWGSRFLASKTTPVMAEHFGIRPGLTRVYAYGISGFIAGLAGGMYAEFLGGISGAEFGSTLSLTVLLYAVVGGVSALWGTLMGATLFIGIPGVLDLNRFGSSPLPALVTGALVVLLMATSVDGIVGLCRHPSDILPSSRVGRAIVRRFFPVPVDVSTMWADIEVETTATSRADLSSVRTALPSKE